MRLNIPFKNFQSTRPIRGFGKGGTLALQINDFKISLRSTERESKNLKFPIVVADVPSIKKSGEDNLNSSLMLSTLIGLDFLESNGLKLVADLPNNSAYLETAEQIYYFFNMFVKKEFFMPFTGKD